MAFDYEIPYTESPMCGACGFKLRRVEERLSTQSFPAARWKFLSERRAIGVVCPICGAATRMDLRTPITGLPHILAQEMPTDPDPPAITLDDAAVELEDPREVVTLTPEVAAAAGLPVGGSGR